MGDNRGHADDHWHVWPKSESTTHTYGQLCIHKGIQLKSELNTPEPDRSQHDRPAHRLIAQECLFFSNFSFIALSFLQGKFRCKNITWLVFLLFFFKNLRKCRIALFEIAHV